MEFLIAFNHIQAFGAPSDTDLSNFLKKAALNVKSIETKFGNTSIDVSIWSLQVPKVRFLHLQHEMRNYIYHIR